MILYFSHLQINFMKLRLLYKIQSGFDQYKIVRRE